MGPGDDSLSAPDTCVVHLAQLLHARLVEAAHDQAYREDEERSDRARRALELDGVEHHDPDMRALRFHRAAVARRPELARLPYFLGCAPAEDPNR